MFKEKFTKEELESARQNGFILVGKTGAGKSTLLNVLYNGEIAEAKKSAFAVTKKSKVYYLKLENGTCISLVDTPGLSDPNIVCDDQKDLDKNHLLDIEKTVSDEKIHIKGILFLVNFQEERFDKSEQDALVSYNALFPLRSFWQHLIVIFTHDFPDPNGDSIEEMKQMRDESNGIIFSKIMNKVKNVSDVIEYKDLRVKYYNSYSPVKNYRQRVQNNNNKRDLEILLNELCQIKPLFCQIEVIHVKNEKIERDGKKYLVEYERIGYFDLNHIPLKEKINIINEKQIYSYQYSYHSSYSTSYNHYVIKPDPPKKPEDPISPPTIKKATEENSKYLQGAGIGGLIGAAAGAIGGGIVAGVVAGPALIVGGIGAVIGIGAAKLFS